MAITINNGIANIDGTPGAISGVFSNRPAALNVAEGTLYFATDTAAIYQAVAGSWINYAGGGGGTPGIDDVLAVGQLLTNNRILNAANFQLDIALVKVCNIFSNNGTTFFVQDDVIATTSNTANGFGYFVDFALRKLRLGDTQTLNNSTILNIDDITKTISSNFNGIENGFKLDFDFSIYKLGDFGALGILAEINLQSRNFIVSDTSTGDNFTLNFAAKTATLTDFNEIIFYNLSGGGLFVDFGASIIGDYNSIIATDCYLGVDAVNLTLLAGADLLVGSSGSVSGQHLKIKIGGNDYVIELRNP